jgi:M6 family metalloprotease-like protein
MTLLGNLIKEAVNHFDAQGHDFSQYDNNGDGVLDYFVVIWAGPDNGWGNFWWGYQTVFPDNTYTVDGVRLGKISWQWEANPVGGAFTPVVVIHETGHALGIPDYYDYDSSVGPQSGVGGLDMMDSAMGDLRF